MELKNNLLYLNDDIMVWSKFIKEKKLNILKKIRLIIRFYIHELKHVHVYIENRM